MSNAFDAIIIGAGQAGPPLAEALVGKGWKVALIEREHFGGTCVNDGCTPTKTLVASARVAYLARRAADFGIMLDGDVTIDMKAVKARKDKIVNASIESLTEWLENMEGLTVFWGEAKFVSHNKIEIGGKTLTASRIFINTGARASIPDWPGLDTVPYLTNTSILELETVPSHLIIAGASYIGLEFAQMYARFGARVTVVDRGSKPASREDDDVSQAIRDILEAEGIEFVFGADVKSVEAAGDGLSVTLTLDGKAKSVEGSHLLIALGRKPNTDALDLKAAGLETNEKGYIEVDHHLKTRVEGIWALGDVNGKGAFTHTSYNDFEIVADNLAKSGTRSLTDRIPVYGLFIDPPLGRIGMSEAEVRKSGKKALMATMEMKKVARARERGETQGLMKVLVDAETGIILGAAILGIEGDEVVHTLLAHMAAKSPYTVLQETVHIHPTVSELVPTLLGNLEMLK